MLGDHLRRDRFRIVLPRLRSFGSARRGLRFHITAGGNIFPDQHGEHIPQNRFILVVVVLGPIHDLIPIRADLPIVSILRVEPLGLNDVRHIDIRAVQHARRLGDFRRAGSSAARVKRDPRG